MNAPSKCRDCSEPSTGLGHIYAKDKQGVPGTPFCFNHGWIWLKDTSLCSKCGSKDLDACKCDRKNKRLPACDRGVTYF